MPTKLCQVCGSPVAEDGEDIELPALRHYIDEHPKEESLTDILTSTWVQVACQDCGQAFFSPVSYGPQNSRIGADAYCPECDGRGFRQLMVQELNVVELVSREVEPGETTLDNRRVFDTDISNAPRDVEDSDAGE